MGVGLHNLQSKRIFLVFILLLLKIWKVERQVTFLSGIKKYPAHLNLCFEESYRHSFDTFPDLPTHPVIQKELDKTKEEVTIIANYPFVIVGTLLEKDREAVLEWLKRVNSPVYCEATSGLRGHPELKSVAIYSINSLCNRKEYPIDHVLRVGGVPTARFWRDLEKKEGEMKVSSLSHLPFSGLSWGGVTHSSSCNYQILGSKQKGLQKLLDKDKEARKNLDHLLNESVGAEPWWIRELSLVIPEGSLVYLGNSQPIREWDLAATREEKHFLVEANRGVNGIDGQLSTFLGLARSKISNWAIVGDLTALYDLAAPWILSQLEAKNVTIVVINNSGGKIFSRLFENPSLQNQHDFRLKGLAELWKMDYLHCKDPSELEPNTDKPRIIECFPDEEATKQFWGVYKKGR